MRLKNFSNYEIYPEEGKVWSYKSQRFIGYQKPDGYWQVGLTDDDGEKHRFQLSRLIWMSVHGDIPQDYEINHLDENPNNNVISNLSACSHLENIRYGTGIQRSADKRRGVPNPKVAEKLTNRQDQSKQVGAYQNGVLIMVFQSTREAQRLGGFNQGNISKCCRNCFNREGNNIYRGYQWRYIN